MAKPTPQDEADAKAILEAGWRQASVLSPRDDANLRFLHGDYDPSSELMVVCTQSCNCVSPNFDANPIVEMMVAKRLLKYQARSPEARGNNARVFHLKIDGDTTTCAVECHVIRRASMDRRELLHCQPMLLTASKTASRQFAGWLSRYYGRAALPNALVEKGKKKTGVFTLVHAALKELLANHKQSVRFIYIKSEPDEEIGADEDGRIYDLWLRFLCDNVDCIEALDRMLISNLQHYDNDQAHDQLRVRWEVTLTSQTMVSDLNGYERFSDLDDLSDIEEHRETYSSPLPVD